jgi:hypothetical protein
MAVEPARDEAPGRRRAVGQPARLAGIESITGEGTRGCRLQRSIAPARPRESRNRDRLEQLAPAQPAHQLRQDVGAHQPDEMRVRIKRRSARTVSSV